ncbi:hypothetical protein S245_019082, partial [Arachis hypogaea]
MKRIVFESKSKDSFERDWHDFIEEYDLHNSRWLNGSIIFWFLAASVWLLYRCYFIVIMDVALREVAAILRGAMDSAREKLREHKEFEHQAAHVPSAIYSHTHDECPVSMDELHGPRRVPTRGRTTSTRLGADLEKSIKKRARKNKNTHNHNK